MARLATDVHQARIPEGSVQTERNFTGMANRQPARLCLPKRGSEDLVPPYPGVLIPMVFRRMMPQRSRIEHTNDNLLGFASHRGSEDLVPPIPGTFIPTAFRRMMPQRSRTERTNCITGSAEKER
jgi:hypothetical protein